MKISKILIALLFIASVSCSAKKVGTPTISKEAWGNADGKDVSLYTLTNKNGMIIKISNWGGAITSILVPDKAGKMGDVVMGFDDLKGYQSGHPFFGSLVGRYGNRIAKGKFSLNGTEYTLATNNWPNHLHGGKKGFDKQVWDASDIFSNADSTGLTLTYLSKDMEEGYPGNLTIVVKYVLSNNNEIKIKYEAVTDKPTVLNPTNHSYFNLTGCKESVLNHEVTLYADSITPTDRTLIPTGKVEAVKGTPFDFITSHKIGERIKDVPGGYDINYVLTDKSKSLKLAVEVYEPESGRLLQAYTTEPGIQFYSGNGLNGAFTGHDGIKYVQYSGLCIEAQHYPDSPNRLNFPSVVLNPGEKYHQVTVYKFSTK